MFRERNEWPSTAGGLPAEERRGYVELCDVLGRTADRRVIICESSCPERLTYFSRCSGPLKAQGSILTTDCPKACRSVRKTKARGLKQSEPILPPRHVA